MGMANWQWRLAVAGVSSYLGVELLVVGEEGVVLGAGGVELAAERVVVLLQLLRLPPRAPAWGRRGRPDSGARRGGGGSGPARR